MDDNERQQPLDEFAKFNMENPVLLYPAYTLQKQLRDKVLGEL